MCPGIPPHGYEKLPRTGKRLFPKCRNGEGGGGVKLVQLKFTKFVPFSPADGSKIVVVLKKSPFFNCGRIIYYITNKNTRLNKTYALYLND
jgi:hypothetical protein